ncbi:patatin-like phospholipase family protein [Roseomonas sp. NAR14]|uniref:Patatin-like phospholipase family protein n=1 Tax=Roseomonas acroporae TaxID=2937791 RepID=A0A9X1YDY7_9PROT|nr:patatin-like phospholipase family protein [Roseomonas acroporae]MCK8784681.1 patatin-like phospholipase family protein [Roseomonas acroporae]
MDGSMGVPLPAAAIASDSTATVSMALQGGGTHGAFTWGVLERLLEDERVEFDAVSGTSAGGINAAMLAQGLAEGGRAGAIAALERFWSGFGAVLAFSPLRNTPWEKALWGFDLGPSLAWQGFDALTRMFSPYQLNPTPFDLNPLRWVLEKVVDADRLRRDPSVIRTFVSATNVRTGKPRVFRREEMSVEVLLASACLPQIFQAVAIEGEHYWDGGYVGNPALWPLYDKAHSGSTPSTDIVIVQLNPGVREELPITVSDITNRLNEITFNASLMAEFRAIDFVQRLLDEGRLQEPNYRRLHLHMIEDEATMRRFNLSTKLNGDWEFLTALRRHGRGAAERWLDGNFASIGRESSLDIRTRYL